MRHLSRHHGSTTKSAKQAGFTIVELMIATVVFSMVLLIITVGVLHFTSSYYKGVNSSATQTAAQNTIDTISQAIQFGSSTPVGTDTAPSGVFCAGNEMFLYTLGVKYTGATPSSSNWGLYMFPNPQASNCDTGGISDFSGGKELLGVNMRLTSVSLTASNAAERLWQVSLGVAYGDADLLCNSELGTGTQGACDKSAPDYDSTAIVDAADDSDTVLCKIQTGSQFCSVATLSAVAQQRLAGS